MHDIFEQNAASCNSSRLSQLFADKRSSMAISTLSPHANDDLKKSLAALGKKDGKKDEKKSAEDALSKSYMACQKGRPLAKVAANLRELDAAAPPAEAEIDDDETDELLMNVLWSSFQKERRLTAVLGGELSHDAKGAIADELADEDESALRDMKTRIKQKLKKNSNF